MNIDYFPGCCGIYVLHSLNDSSYIEYLGEDESVDFFYDYTKDDGNNEDYEVPLRGTIDELQDRALFATTVDCQESAIKYLVENRFKPVYKFKNPNSSTKVTVWIRSPRDSSGKKVY